MVRTAPHRVMSRTVADEPGFRVSADLSALLVGFVDFGIAGARQLDDAAVVIAVGLANGLAFLVFVRVQRSR